LAEAILHEPEWLAARRERAASLRDQLDLPRFKGAIGWEFTDLGAFDLDAFGPAPADAELTLPEPLFEASGVSLTQVDAHSEAGETGPDGVIVMALGVAAQQHPELVEPHLGTIVPADDIFVAANDAGWSCGALVYVPRGVRVEAPILLNAVTAAAGTALQRRVLIVLEEGAEAEVWEQYLSADDESESVFNTVVELVVGQNAKLRYICGQDLNEKSWIFGAQRAEVQRDGKLDWVAAGFGSARGRVRMETKLAGDGAEAKVTGAYLPHGRQHVDFDTTQEHAAPNTFSDLAFRGILGGRSSAVWRGVIKVDPGAQQTDAFQECRNLLLSKRAHVDAIPGLEILANDVRCTHAAAIAQIDKDQLFYLRSRGLPEAQAKRLVIEGFMAELVERFEEGQTRDILAGALERRLSAVLD
jgi:Fe-S cluster assembly protein SufD